MSARRTLLIVFLLAMTMSPLPGFSLDAVGQDARFGVSPSLLELEAKPGADGEVAITVSNTGDVPLNAVTGVASIPSAAPSHSAEAWLSVEPASIALEPGRDGVLNVTIAVPDELQTGGYYAYVTVTAGQEDEGEGANTAAIQGQLAVPFLVTVDGEGEIERSLEIERFAPVLQPDGRIGFAALIRNSGNIHVSPSGMVEVTLGDGSAYGSLEFVQATPLLPGAERLVVTQGTLPVQDSGSYVAAAEIGGADFDPASVEAPFTMAPPELAIDGLSICENLDRGPSVTLNLRNASSLGITGMVTVAVSAADGAPAGQAMLEQPPIIWPQETLTLSSDIQQRLVSGDYVLTVTVTPAIGSPITAELPFAIGGTGPNTAPICQAPSAPEADG